MVGVWGLVTTGGKGSSCQLQGLREREAGRQEHRYKQQGMHARARIRRGRDVGRVKGRGSGRVTECVCAHLEFQGCWCQGCHW